jgi:hypothetical protein
MNWPSKPSLPPDVIDELNARIECYLNEDPGEDGGSDGAAAKQLILDLHQIYVADLPEATRQQLHRDLAVLVTEWDTDKPELTHAQKYLNRLFRGEDKRASEYIAKVIEQKAALEDSLTKKTLSESGTKGAKKKHARTNEAKETALAYYKKNASQFNSKKEAARELEKMFQPITFNTYYKLLCKLRR